MKLLGRSDHGNISNVCDWLESQEFIRMCFKESHRGRPEKFYQITHFGIVYLVENSPTPEDFWSTLMFLVFYQKLAFSWQKIVELFDIYLQRYLKHYLKQVYYYPQLDEFNLACKSWYEKAIIQGETISLSQKVLEALAVNPGVTLDKIAQAVGEKVSMIEPIIKSYTVIPHTPVAVDVHGHYDSPFYDITEWRFQIHRAITETQSSKQGKAFSLSLFGILMVLYIIMKKHSEIPSQGLMYNYGLQQYFDVIAKNYKSKIPFIFGNWPVLKSMLSQYSCLNFRTIVDKHIREISFQDSVKDNGNKELYVGIKEIISVSQKQLVELQRAGMNVIFNFSPAEGDTIQPTAVIDRVDVSRKTNLVFQLFQYLSSLIRPTDYDSESFISMFRNENYLGPTLAGEIGLLYDVSHLEISLAYEISFIYFLSLRSRRVFTYYNDKPVLLEQILKNILKSDKDIGIFFKEHLANISKYYREVHQLVQTISVADV